MRGGGGNFGIVTEFEFRLSPLGPQVVAGPVFWPMEEAPNVLRFYREWIADAPDELMTIVVQRKAPALPTVPPELVGRRVLGVVCCWAGSIEEGREAVLPLKEFGSPVLDLCVPKPFVAHQRMFDPSFRPGCWYYVRSCDVAGLNDDILDVMVDYGHRIESPLTSIALWQMGGAVSRVGEDETAFNGRNVGFTFNINGNTESAAGFDEEREWARAYWSALSPHHVSVYVNFLMEDPNNFFRLNQNVSPG